MAFKIAKIVGRLAAHKGVSVSYSRAWGKRDGLLPRLVVGIPASATAAWKFKEGQRFAIAFGDGPDAGKTRIMLSDTGAGMTMLRGAAAVIRFGHVPSLGEDAAAKERVPYRILDPKKDNGAILEITGPAWLKPEDERDE